MAKSSAPPAGAAMFADEPPATLAPVVGFQVSMVPLALAWPNQPAFSMLAPNTHMALEFAAVPSGQPPLVNGSLCVSPIHAMTVLSAIFEPAHDGSSMAIRSAKNAS